MTAGHLVYGDRPGRTLILLAGRLGPGGAERHTVTLANELARQFRVVVAYLRPDEELVPDLHRESLLDLRCLNVKKRLDLRAARDLAQLATQHRADVIVCANAYALLYAHMARVFLRAPISIAEVFHTTKPRSVKEFVSMLVYRPLFWATDHLVFVCEAQRQYWRRRGLWARRTYTIYNGVDMEHFDPSAVDSRTSAQLRASAGFAKDDRVVGICAGLRPEKAHADLLSAVALLREQGVRWRVAIIGDGPERPAIERTAAELGLSDSVWITGFEPDVRGWLSACDVVALVSTSETFSIASLEAMAMRKPMIMSDVGGAREQIVQGVNGVLFPPGDVRRLAECLRAMDPATASRMGAAARERIERDFSLPSMVRAYEALFSSIVAGRASSGGSAATT